MSGEVPRVRRAAIPDDALLVVRGDEAFDFSVRQARRFRRRFPGWGRYGVSAFYARNDDEVIDLGVDRLDQFRELLVFRLDAIIEAGLEVVPTFRSPHVTIAFAESPEKGLEKLMAIPHQRVVNDGFQMRRDEDEHSD